MEEGAFGRHVVGQALMRLREDAGLSQPELAERIGLESGYVPAVEAGEIDLRWETVMRFLGGLDVSLRDFATEIEERPNLRV
jgi:transcriptional regulator with XRE-family HTH domain